MKVWRNALVLSICLFLSACATSKTYGSAESSQVIGANYIAAERLIATAQRPIPKDAPIVVATLVKLNNLSASSNLGRLISEHLSSRLTQLGFAVPELKLRGIIFVRAGSGELLLSNDVRDIAQSHHAQAVVVGTYAIGADVVYVHTELVDAITGNAISAYDYYIPMIEQVMVLLGLK